MKKSRLSTQKQNKLFESFEAQLSLTHCCPTYSQKDLKELPMINYLVAISIFKT